MKIEIKKHQFQNKLNQNVIIQCDSNTASYVLGNVDSTWIDVTNDCGGLEDLSILMKSNAIDTRRSEKSATAQLTFINASARLILDYLYETPCAQLNYFDVRITDEINSIVYNDFELKADNLEFTENEGCEVSLPLRESNIGLNKLEKLSIFDNHQKWFSEDGTKEFPTFMVTKFSFSPLFQSANIGLMFFLKTLTDFSIVGLVADFGIENAIRESFGVGRYIASPSIDDLLQNLCDKLGATKQTIPEFANDHVILADSGIYFHNENYNDQGSPSRKFVQSNGTTYMAKEFLDAICEVYNCFWNYENDVLTITRRIANINDVYADVSSQIIGNKSYIFDETKKASNGNYRYATDAIDSYSNKIQIAYNDIVDFDGEADNPMCEGSITKNFRFASTNFFHSKFGIDDFKELIDYSRYIGQALAILTVALTTWIIAALSTSPLTAGLATALLVITAGIVTNITIISNQYKNELGDTSNYAGSIFISGPGEMKTMRIIRRDTLTPINASKAVKTTASAIGSGYASQFIGKTVYAEITNVWNYPLYFDAKYQGNLYDFHRDTDDPFIVNLLNKSVNFYLALCKENIELLGVSNENGKIINKVVKISSTEKVLIKEVEINYENMYIKIKGRLIA